MASISNCSRTVNECDRLQKENCTICCSNLWFVFRISALQAGAVCTWWNHGNPIRCYQLSEYQSSTSWFTTALQTLTYRLTLTGVCLRCIYFLCQVLLISTNNKGINKTITEKNDVESPRVRHTASSTVCPLSLSRLLFSRTAARSAPRLAGPPGWPPVFPQVVELGQRYLTSSCLYSYTVLSRYLSILICVFDPSSQMRYTSVFRLHRCICFLLPAFLHLVLDYLNVFFLF